MYYFFTYKYEITNFYYRLKFYLLFNYYTSYVTLYRTRFGSSCKIRSGLGSGPRTLRYTHTNTFSRKHGQQPPPGSFDKFIFIPKYDCKRYFNSLLITCSWSRVTSHIFQRYFLQMIFEKSRRAKMSQRHGQNIGSV